MCGDGVAIIGSSANVTFTSDDPGAVFNCKLNGKKIIPCKYMISYSQLTSYNVAIANYIIVYNSMQVLLHCCS